jgi:hypothetical protein
MRKELGKIISAKFGLGGYQGVQIGIHIQLGSSASGSGWGVCTSKSGWDPSVVECSGNCKWTEADRAKQHDEIVRYISGLLKDAKVESVDKLVGIPVEVTFDGNAIQSFRILSEVI